MGAWLALSLVLRAGLAQSIPDGIRVSAEPSDVMELYRYAASEAGLEGPALSPACRAWSPFFAMCFMIEEDARLRLVHQGDLDDWEIGFEELESHVREHGREVLTDERGELMDIVDMREDAYWLFDNDDGFDASVLLYPDWMAERIGGEMVVAVPSRGRVLAWTPGDADVDRVIAIGVRRLYDESQIPVSSVIVRWNGRMWVRWGEAQARPEP